MTRWDNLIQINQDLILRKAVTVVDKSKAVMRNQEQTNVNPILIYD